MRTLSQQGSIVVTLARAINPMDIILPNGLLDQFCDIMDLDRNRWPCRDWWTPAEEGAWNDLFQYVTSEVCLHSCWIVSNLDKERALVVRRLDHDLFVKQPEQIEWPLVPYKWFDC